MSWSQPAHSPHPTPVSVQYAGKLNAQKYEHDIPRYSCCHRDYDKVQGDKLPHVSGLRESNQHQTVHTGPSTCTWRQLTQYLVPVSYNCYQLTGHYETIAPYDPKLTL